MSTKEGDDRYSSSKIKSMTNFQLARDYGIHAKYLSFLANQGSIY